MSELSTLFYPVAVATKEYAEARNLGAIPIHTINSDLLSLILKELVITDIAHLGATCRTMRQMTRERPLMLRMGQARRMVTYSKFIGWLSHYDERSESLHDNKQNIVSVDISIIACDAPTWGSKAHKYNEQSPGRLFNVLTLTGTMLEIGECMNKYSVTNFWIDIDTHDIGELKTLLEAIARRLREHPELRLSVLVSGEILILYGPNVEDVQIINPFGSKLKIRIPTSLGSMVVPLSSANWDMTPAAAIVGSIKKVTNSNIKHYGDLLLELWNKSPESVLTDTIIYDRCMDFICGKLLKFPFIKTVVVEYYVKIKMELLIETITRCIDANLTVIIRHDTLGSRTFFNKFTEEDRRWLMRLQSYSNGATLSGLDYRSLYPRLLNNTGTPTYPVIAYADTINEPIYPIEDTLSAHFAIPFPKLLEIEDDEDDEPPEIEDDEPPELEGWEEADY